MSDLTPEQIDSLSAPPPTPLLAALYDGDRGLARSLVAAGADPNAADTRFLCEGWTPLHLAADSDDVEFVSALLAAGADVNARTAYGHTPLWWACNNGMFVVAEELLAAGADPNARCVEGYSPLGRVQRSEPALVELMRSHGGEV